jgi:hypothetical protein
MQSARRLIWLNLVLGLLFAVTAGLWLGILYSGSSGEVPNVLARLGRAVSETQDISSLKKACLMLANVTEDERLARLHFVVFSGGMTIALGLLCAAVSTRLLILLNKADRS